MKLDHLRDYLTMPEIASKWKATDPEMCRAVLKGLLRPSIFLNAPLRPVDVTPDGAIQLSDREPEHLVGWHFLTPVQQVGALDCSAPTVALLPQVSPGSAMWALDQPLAMRDVMCEAVVMADDLAQAEELLEAETHCQQRSGKTKEFNSVLNILSILLADTYRYDPRVRSGVCREITEAGENFGIAVSVGTVTKWAREAIEQFPPNYMNEPQKEASAAVPRSQGELGIGFRVSA